MSLPPLSPQQLVKPRYFELRLSLLFAALFVSQGLHLPYFPLWLENRGFGPQDIAIILAAPMFLRVVTTPFIAAMADRAKDRATVLIALAAATVVISFGYFLPATYLTVMLVSLGLAVVWTPHTPLADSLALSGVRRFGSNYASMRIWGSMSFLCANFAGGALLSSIGAASVPALLAITFISMLAASLFAPRLGRPRQASPLSAADLQVTAPKLLTRHFLLFLGGAGLITGSHAFLYGFVSIYWKSIGIDDTMIGFLWAFAVIAEVGVFMIYTRVFGRVSASALLALAAAFSVVRWALFPLVWGAGLGILGFLLIQALHAFTAGLMLISVQKLIAETVSEERTGAAQGVAFFANGICMAAATLLSGPLYGWFGIGGFYVMAAIAFGGLILIGFALRLPPESGLGR